MDMFTAVKTWCNAADDKRILLSKSMKAAFLDRGDVGQKSEGRLRIFVKLTVISKNVSILAETRKVISLNCLRDRFGPSGFQPFRELGMCVLFSAVSGSPWMV